jgi:antibiotic biosynthesis monooxygenase (ABM) superfamily enzyme
VLKPENSTKYGMLCIIYAIYMTKIHFNLQFRPSISFKFLSAGQDVREHFVITHLTQYQLTPLLEELDAGEALLWHEKRAECSRATIIYSKFIDPYLQLYTRYLSSEKNIVYLEECPFQ